MVGFEPAGSSPASSIIDVDFKYNVLIVPIIDTAVLKRYTNICAILLINASFMFYHSYTDIYLVHYKKIVQTIQTIFSPCGRVLIKVLIHIRK